MWVSILGLGCLLNLKSISRNINLLSLLLWNPWQGFFAGRWIKILQWTTFRDILLKDFFPDKKCCADSWDSNLALR